jgi:hypothetical protein
MGKQHEQGPFSARHSRVRDGNGPVAGGSVTATTGPIDVGSACIQIATEEADSGLPRVADGDMVSIDAAFPATELLSVRPARSIWCTAVAVGLTAVLDPVLAARSWRRWWRWCNRLLLGRVLLALGLGLVSPADPAVPRARRPAAFLRMRRREPAVVREQVRLSERARSVRNSWPTSRPQSGAIWTAVLSGRQRGTHSKQSGSLSPYRTTEAHRVAAPTPTQRQSAPQEPSLHVPAGQAPAEAQRVLPPAGLMQVHLGPQESTVLQGSAEQVPAARQRRLTPPISRHTQPGPQ